MTNTQTYSTPLVWITAALLSALMAGCNNGADPILGGDSNNITQLPTVTATVPIASTPAVSGVATNSKITATFSKDMQSASINDLTFLVTCPGLTPIAGAVSYTPASRVASFTPTSSLPTGAVCNAMITTGVMDNSGSSLETAFSWFFSTSLTADTTRPTVTLNVPSTGASAVPLNTKITATFSEAMDASTFISANFTLTGPGITPVAGNVSYAAGAKTATFTPTTPVTLAASTVYTATITSAVTDLAGNTLSGNSGVFPASSNFVWTFTTGTVNDATAPTVALISPALSATNICLQKSVNATFNEAMDPLTLTTATFTLQKSGSPLGPLLSGTVAYDAPSKVATLNPTAALLASTQYTATITKGANDLAGNALAAAKIWTFTTGSQACSAASPIDLGTASTFGDLGGTAGTTNNGILTVIGGDISSTATVTSAITGLHDSAGDIYTETGSDQGAVNGKIYSCTVSTLGPTAAAVNASSCSIATQALMDAQTAFDNLSPASMPGGTDPGAGQLGGLTLAPGVYMAAGGSFLITGSDLTLDGQGDANAVWVFQTASTLGVGAPGAPRSIILINGAQAKNVFWHVGTSATINAAGGGTMIGTILASSAVSFSTIGNVAVVTLNGRAVGLNASVTMTNTVINVPAP